MKIKEKAYLENKISAKKAKHHRKREKSSEKRKEAAIEIRNQKEKAAENGIKSETRKLMASAA